MKAMQSYRDLIGDTYKGCPAREPVEWSNFWYDGADCRAGRRCLLIGDSTIRMVRSTFAKVAGCPVDMFGTSSALDDELFVSQIDAFFGCIDYRYDAIFVQTGHHGRIGKDGGRYGEDDFLKFGRDYRCLLSFLRQYSDKIIIETIYDSVIPPKILKADKYLFKGKIHRCLVRLGLEKEIPDDTINGVTRRKNDIVMSLAASEPYPVILLDINGIMNRTEYVHIDHIHFEDAAKMFIAHRMQEML